MMRSRSPTQAAAAAARLEARKKYTYAAFFLVISLVSFTVQTMLASHIQHDLGWNKAYCMLYLTHGSWVFLWPLQLLILRSQRQEQPWRRFWEGHVRTLRGIALVVETRDVRAVARGREQRQGGLLEYGHSPWPYLAKATAVITTALTVAGLSWYLAVSMTTPSDLTAIYNCSAFFAYAFSVPLLKERVRADKMLAVAVAIVGVLVVAYGDGSGEESESASSSAAVPGDAVDPGARFAGNLIIGVGSVLYGLYEVLYKRFACPPDGMDATKGVIFANTFGSLMGGFTLCVLWIPLPVLHVLGWETFEIPTGETAWLLFVSVFMNMLFSGSFLVLISLTSPVLSSVASLLTIFMVAMVDWFLTGAPLSGAAMFGGLLIVAAFVMLSWSTWREMNEEERRKQVDLSGDEDD
jgi:drug/metabolite transporter (DMT)-like permease